MKNITRLFAAAVVLFASSFGQSVNILPNCPVDDPTCKPVQQTIEILPNCPTSDPTCQPNN